MTDHGFCVRPNRDPSGTPFWFAVPSGFVPEWKCHENSQREKSQNRREREATTRIGSLYQAELDRCGDSVGSTRKGEFPSVTIFITFSYVHCWQLIVAR